VNAEEFLAVLRARRSVRRFRPEPVAHAVLERLIEHAAWAPSASNRQDWLFIAVTREETRRALGEAVCRRWSEIIAANRDAGWVAELERYAVHFSGFTAAPAVIGVACREPDELMKHLAGAEAVWVGGGAASAAMAAQNLMLAAHALDLGSCCYTGALAARAELEELLAVPRRWRLLCLIGVGVPDEQPVAPARKPVAEIARFIE
jgi:nitroreductase